MAIITTVRCSNMRKSLAFYTNVLDFERIDGDDELDDPCYNLLAREGDRLILSSHRGDGTFGKRSSSPQTTLTRFFESFERGAFRPRATPTLLKKFMKAPSTSRGARARSTSTTRTATHFGSPKVGLTGPKRNNPFGLHGFSKTPSVAASMPESHRSFAGQPVLSGDSQSRRIGRPSRLRPFHSR